MGRFREVSDEEQETAIDISPLIDCVFILLIFFIVTTVFVEETGIEVDKPQAASASDLEANSLLFAVTTEGDVVYGGEQVTLARVQSIVKRQIQEEAMPVIIQADENSKSGMLMKVVDAAKLGGAETINVATAMPGS